MLTNVLNDGLEAYQNYIRSNWKFEGEDNYGKISGVPVKLKNQPFQHLDKKAKDSGNATKGETKGEEGKREEEISGIDCDGYRKEDPCPQNYDLFYEKAVEKGVRNGALHRVLTAKELLAHLLTAAASKGWLFVMELLLKDFHINPNYSIGYQTQHSYNETNVQLVNAASIGMPPLHYACAR